MTFTYLLTGWQRRKYEVVLLTCELADKALNRKVPSDYAVHIQTHQDYTVDKDRNFYKYTIHTGFTRPVINDSTQQEITHADVKHLNFRIYLITIIQILTFAKIKDYDLHQPAQPFSA